MNPPPIPRGRRAAPLAALLLVAIALATFAHRERHRSDTTAQPVLVAGASQRQQPNTMHRERPGSQQARVEVPAGWTVVASGRDYRTWADSGKLHTVTLGTVAASAVPLTEVVRRSRRVMRRELPNTTPRALVTLAGGSVRSELVAGPTSARIHIAQAWTRSGAVDAIATWTSADGRWPVPAARQAPSFA